MNAIHTCFLANSNCRNKVLPVDSALEDGSNVIPNFESVFLGFPIRPASLLMVSECTEALFYIIAAFNDRDMSTRDTPECTILVRVRACLLNISSHAGIVHVACRLRTRDGLWEKNHLAQPEDKIPVH